jgi:phosphotransferase system  glucose/maltose/N-acetylglucosamine-specific IIC component
MSTQEENARQLQIAILDLQLKYDNWKMFVNGLSGLIVGLIMALFAALYYEPNISFFNNYFGFLLCLMISFAIAIIAITVKLECARNNDIRKLKTKYTYTG